jgi:predicted AlkP superfamily phosphohydrolase/phosphomutase
MTGESGSGALLVGWDGATWDLLDPLLDEGRLPHLAGLIRRGTRGLLRSTFPPVTPAAWTEMATGWNAGRTGVLGFRDLDLTRLSGFSGHAPSSRELRGNTLFEWAARAGAGVSLVGWPMTFPAFALPGGALLAGWPRPREQRPPVAPSTLDAGGLLGPWAEGDPRPQRRRSTVEQDIVAESWWDRRHAEIASLWLRRRDDPVTAVVFSGTDHLSHRLWGDPRLADHFARADGLLGQLMEAAGPRRSILLVSDHGFGPAARRVVHMGRALERLGWLATREATGDAHGSQRALGRALGRVRRAAPKGAWRAIRDRLPHEVRRWGFERAAGVERIVPERTRAFAVELHEAFVGVHLCVRGRMPGGTVEPAHRNEQLSLLTGRLLELRDDHGAALVVDVQRREGLYSGPRIEDIPDLLVELAEDCRWGSGLGPGPLVEETAAEDRARFPGSHRRDGVVVLAGPDVLPGVRLQAPRVTDVGLTLLAAAGLAVPDDRDGRPWEEALRLPVRLRAGSGPVRLDASAPTPAEQAVMDDALRGLGYL